MSKVFVSYKRVDKDKVFPLVRKMESELGVKFWIDLDGIESDEQFTDVIINAIIDCEVFLFMCSKSHENIDPKKDWTVREINFADYNEKRIVFIDLDGCRLPNWIVFNFPQRQVTNANDKEAISRLINDIRKWLNLPQPNSSPNIQGQTPDTKDTPTKLHGQSVTQEPSDPHLAIDLGLPSGTKWASCNVGASKPEEYGDYFAWGETEKKNFYDWATYIHCDGNSGTCHNLGSDIAGTEFDVARINWGGKWQMPTKEQFDELLRYCLHEWTTMNGVEGYKFTSKINGNSIFLPAAGSRDDSDLDDAGSNGYYWSSTQYPSDARYAYDLSFTSGYVFWSSGHRRLGGQSVRPVSRN